ncbi:radical SAM protein [Candidatus Woesearchaeota archaeon]|nr:radical SAM protein [Candidatus Woesearchaeota archaeon]
MVKEVFPLVSYAVQSKGPLLSGLMLDNGLALLGAEVAQEGLVPVIFDYSTVGSIEKIARDGKQGFLDGVVAELDAFIKEHGVRKIGFKLYANGFQDSVLIAARLKERNPDIRVFGGGPQVSWFGDSVFGYARSAYGSDVFDALVAGEGDAAIRAIAQDAEVSRIPGAIYRQGGHTARNKKQEVELDGLPYPTYDPAVYRGIDEKIKVYAIEDSRNCDWRKCTFCIHPRIGGRFREKSVAGLIKEVEFNQRTYGFNIFRLSGPDPKVEYVNATARMLPEGARFSAFGRADHVGYDFDLLSKTLVGGVFIGLESADPAILRDMKKADDPIEYVRNAEVLIHSLKEHGIPSVASCIVPAPNETDESMARTLDFLLRTNPDFTPVLPMWPMPGTVLMKTADPAQGILLEEGYVARLMAYEIDLLQPSGSWPKPPWKLRVNGEFVDNPFEVSGRFAKQIAQKGMRSLSDEIVLMADLYHGRLSLEQDGRRAQCHEFNASCRVAIQEGDVGFLRYAVERINRNSVRL